MPRQVERDEPVGGASRGITHRQPREPIVAVQKNNWRARAHGEMPGQHAAELDLPLDDLRPAAGHVPGELDFHRLRSPFNVR